MNSKNLQISSGKVKMVDVGEKKISVRTATASATIKMNPKTLALIKGKKIPKGDVFQVARIAAILAAKNTPRIIPLCHPIAITNVEVDLIIKGKNRIKICAQAKAVDRTGVEMEALTACSIAALTVYDMCKMFDRTMVIENIYLLEKTGGKSGDFRRAFS